MVNISSDERLEEVLQTTKSSKRNEYDSGAGASTGGDTLHGSELLIQQIAKSLAIETTKSIEQSNTAILTDGSANINANTESLIQRIAKMVAAHISQSNQVNDNSKTTSISELFQRIQLKKE